MPKRKYTVIVRGWICESDFLEGLPAEYRTVIDVYANSATLAEDEAVALAKRNWCVEFAEASVT